MPQPLINQRPPGFKLDIPPLVLQYEDTIAWSDEDKSMFRKSLQDTTVMQHIQLTKYINAAQQIQWQHEDHTIAQQMQLEDMTQTTSKSKSSQHTDTQKMVRIKYRQQEHDAKLYNDTFHIGESYLAGPWHVRQHNHRQFAILDYSHTGCHLCGEYSKIGPDEFIHHDKHTNWHNSKK